MASEVPHRTMKRGLFPRLAALGAVLLSAGCVKQLPPAPTPEVAPPAASNQPPTAGGRLIVDVVDGPTPVRRVTMVPRPLDQSQDAVSVRFNESVGWLCPVSPCTVDLPPGNVLLGFPVIGDEGALEVELVHVGAETTIYRRALSVYDNTGPGYLLGIIGASVGGVALSTGGVILRAGLRRESDGLTLAGGVTLGAGATLLALGIWGMCVDPPTYRPGAAARFPP